MAAAKLSSKNQIVLPKEAREALGVKPGDSLLFVPDGRGVFAIKKPANILKALRGIASGLYEPDYLQKERQNWSRQEFEQFSPSTASSRSTPTSSSTTSRPIPATSKPPKRSSTGSKRRAAAR